VYFYLLFELPCVCFFFSAFCCSCGVVAWQFRFRLKEIKFKHEILLRLVDFMGATHIVKISKLWFVELYSHMIRTIGIEMGLQELVKSPTK